MHCLTLCTTFLFLSVSVNHCHITELTNIITIMLEHEGSSPRDSSKGSLIINEENDKDTVAETVSAGSYSNLSVMTEMIINLSAVYSTSDSHLMTSSAAIQIHNGPEQVGRTTVVIQ